MHPLHDKLVPFVEVIHLVSIQMLIAERLRLRRLLVLVHDVVFKDLVDSLEQVNFTARAFLFLWLLLLLAHGRLLLYLILVAQLGQPEYDF